MKRKKGSEEAQRKAMTEDDTGMLVSNKVGGAVGPEPPLPP